VTELLVELCRERGTSVVVVTHDDRIYHLADRIVGIEDGEILAQPIPVPPRPGSSAPAAVASSVLSPHAQLDEAQP
jgi:ABC-type lipoprotein export system ATPase subunit